MTLIVLLFLAVFFYLFARFLSFPTVEENRNPKRTKRKARFFR